MGARRGPGTPWRPTEERAKVKPHKRKIANLHGHRWRTIKVVKGGKKAVKKSGRYTA